MYSCVFDKLGSIILHFKFYFILVELKFSIIDHVSIILKNCARFGGARIFLFHQDLCSIYQSFLDILWQAMMIDQWHNDKQAMFFTVAWSLWNNRNDARHGGLRLRKTAALMVQGCVLYLKEYRAASLVTARWACWETGCPLDPSYSSTIQDQYRWIRFCSTDKS